MSQSVWLNFLHLLPPELAHRLVIRLLQVYGALPSRKTETSQNKISCWGLNFPHRLGVAAGLDKDGEAYRGLMRAGFGFVEIGTVTPKPQIGNSAPRLFRLLEDQAVINRMGFNNQGIDALVMRLHRLRDQPRHVLGINIGPNKISTDPIQDYLACYARALPYADYFTINLSSPNTLGLRELQRGAEMQKLLRHLNVTRDQIERETGLRPPMLIKIAPDWTELDDFYRLLDAGVAERFDGFVISNTTIARPAELTSLYRAETGGLSGAPLFPASTALLARAFRHLSGAVPLVGAGGIFSLSDAILKLQAGATLLQVYTGLSIAPKKIVSLLKRDYNNAKEKSIFCSEHSESMIGCEAENLDQEYKVRHFTLVAEY
ncbi:MAG: quinone-dependent dihydroorotate dehydrogenase [Alphaproteobacteria bacterium]|nr:quinone-dependent dihydroorotate dehydrogenase [Alphaproteobacteria bacterium]